jgi:hypothetical protein
MVAPVSTPPGEKPLGHDTGPDRRARGVNDLTCFVSACGCRLGSALLGGDGLSPRCFLGQAAQALIL